MSFLCLFACFLLLLKADLKWVLGLGVLFRLLFILSIPALSDDFYRFIWDGLLWHNGIHPFSQLPSFYMEAGQQLPALSESLFNSLNSRDYFTVYPPLHQLVFWLSTFGFTGNELQAIVIMRCILVGVEITFLFFMAWLIKARQLPTSMLAMYAINPLVIVEVAGNLHFEGMMAFFLLLSIHSLTGKKLLGGSLALAASIATKLTPVISGPVLMFAAGRSSWWKVVLFTSLATVVFFLPLIGPAWLSGQSESIGLYFQKFEFNASLYYVLREVGFWWKGYNIIASLGPWLAVSGAVLILIISWANWPRGRNVYQAISIVFLVYYLTATTVHPWYVVPLVALSAFSGYKFPIVWSYTILWTYLGYTASGYEVPWAAIAAEYLVVIGAFLWEVVLSEQTKQPIRRLVNR